MRIFVAREPELARLSSLLQDARRGEPGVALIDGPGGIGKTSLLRAFTRAEAPRTTTWVSGYEAETILSGGVVEQLFRAADARLPRLNDPVTAGSALLELVGGLADDRVRVLVVDDAHWADTLSINALAFAVRRLRVEHLLVLLAVRTDELDRLPRALTAAGGIERMHLSGLDAPALAELARAVHGRPIGELAVRRLHEYSDGSPLYARALLDELGPDDLGDPALPPAVPPSLSSLISGRAAACDGPARTLLAAASVLGSEVPLGTAVEVAGLTDLAQLPATLDEVARADLATVRAGTDVLAFAHPLTRAAIYHDLPPGTRAALHRRAAAVLGAGLPALRHRIAGTLLPDAALADEVLQAAHGQMAEGAWASAADLFRAVRRLSPDVAVGNRALGRAAECLLFGGDAPGAAAVARELEQLPPEPLRDQVLGNVSIIFGERARGIRLLQRAWETAVHPADDTVAALAANQLGMEALNDGDARGARTWADRALEYPSPPAVRGMPHCVRALADGLRGHAATRLAELDDLPADPDAMHGEHLGRLVGRGMLRLWNDQFVGAIDDLARAEEAARRFGPIYLRIMALIYRADAEYRAGRWDDSLRHAELAVTLAEAAGSVLMLAFAAAVASFVTSGRGDSEGAAAHLAAADRAAGALDAPAMRLWASIARARAAHAAGSPHTALAALQWFAERRDLDGHGEAGVQPWASLYAEALLATGRRDDALEVVGGLLENGHRRGLRSVLVSAYRLRGRSAGAAADAAAAFEEGVTLAGPAPASLEDALVHVDYGTWLRRAGEPAAAHRHLATAHAALSALAARPYLERCEAELVRIGYEPPRAEGRTIRELLTAQEHAVALLVASGASNREAAAQLVLSVKTIEFHLGNVFRKLGVANRHGLIARYHAAGLVAAS